MNVATQFVFSKVWHNKMNSCFYRNPFFVLVQILMGQTAGHLGMARFLRNCWFDFSSSALHLHRDFFFFFFLLFICSEEEKLIFRESAAAPGHFKLSQVPASFVTKAAINLFLFSFHSHLNVGLVTFCSWLKSKRQKKCFQVFSSFYQRKYSRACILGYKQKMIFKVRLA